MLDISKAKGDEGAVELLDLQYTCPCVVYLISDSKLMEN
jgi:hypothetical protein